jgi:nucleoside-diphosphate-sugar epimerase
MKLFVTGATGAIGTYAVPALVAAGHEVTGIARNDVKAASLREQGATPTNVSIFDRAALAEAMSGHDAVVNLATKIPGPSEARKPAAWAENTRIRTEGSAALVDAALEAGVDRFVQESITFAYPSSGDAFVDEDTPLDVPEAIAAMAAAEASAARFTAAGGVGVVLRFGALQGPGTPHTEMILDVARRHVGFAAGPPSNYISTVHLADAGTAVVTALTAPAGTYNVVDDNPMTMAEQARIVGSAVGAKPWVMLPGRLTKLLAPSMAPLARSQRVSNAKLRALGWEPRYPSIAETVAAILAADRSAQQETSSA